MKSTLPLIATFLVGAINWSPAAEQGIAEEEG